VTSRVTTRLGELSPHRVGLWAGCIAPCFALAAGLKTTRIARRGLEAGPLSVPELYLSELTVFATFGLLGHLLLGLLQDGWPRSVGLAGFQVLTVLVGAIELIGHGFYVRTGSAFDADIMRGVFHDADTLLPVVLSELSNAYVLVIALSLALLLVTPWMARSLALEHRDPAASASTDDTSPTFLLLAAAGFAAISVMPTPLEPDTWFSRASTVNLAVSAGWELRQQFDAPPEVESPAAELEATRRPDSASDRPTNVAIVVLESVRTTATGLYNPDRETTPFLSRLAQRSTVAHRAYATVPHTSKALVSILCGIEPKLSYPVAASRSDGAIPARCLPELLGSRDYRSAFFQTAHPYFERQTELVDNIGFETFRTMHDLDREAYHKINYFGWEDDAMLPVSHRWLEQRRKRDEPFVATYLTLASHHPYATPPDFEHTPPTDASRFEKYLASIRYVDRFAKKLVDQYKKLGLYEETLFVFVSDHGQAFGEHGLHFHDDVPYQEGVRIVTMLHDPTRPDAADITRNVSQIDLPPTVLDRLGFRITAGAYRGQPLDNIPPERPIRIQCYLERRCLVRVTGDTKYIYWFGRRPPEVYDLTDDPDERHDLAAETDGLDDWRRDLLDWRRHVNGMYATWSQR